MQRLPKQEVARIRTRPFRGKCQIGLRIVLWNLVSDGALLHQDNVCNKKRNMLLYANDMQATNSHMPRQKGAATAFIENRLAEGRVAFAMTELVAETGLSVVAAKNQIQRLRDRVRRVTRPQAFFLIVDPAHRIMGAPPLQWWLDEYFRWLGHPYYLALLSAAESYGVAPQAVQVHQVITDTPRREISVGRIRVRFFVKRDTERTPVQQPKGAYAPLRVSMPEATALDLVSYASRIGGIGRAHETLIPLLPLMRARKLRHALDAQQSTRSAQRLGYLLERCGADRLADVVHEWLPPGTAWCSLGTREPDASKLHKSQRWRMHADERSLK